MALWAKTQQLPKESLVQVQQTYSSYFPIDLRHYFASWIEEQRWTDIDENNPAHEQFAAQIFTEFIKQINAKISDENLEFVTRLNFQKFAKQLEESYSRQPLQLVRVVKNCLLAEQQLVRAMESVSPLNAVMTQTRVDDVIRQEIQYTIDILVQKTEDTDEDLKQMQLKQEKFVIDYQTQAKISANLTHVQQQPPSDSMKELETKLKKEKEAMDRELLLSAQQILQQRMSLASKHKMTLDMVDKLQKRVTDDELMKWKRQQQLAGNGAPFDTNKINVIQRWYEALADIIWRNRMQILKVDLLRTQLPIDIPQGVTDLQPDLTMSVTDLLTSLVTSTFVVETQPPQVLKKDARFTATVRLLVGGKLNLQLTPPRVEAIIISEQQARGLLQNDDGHRQQKCGEILNNKGPMDYHQHSGQLSYTFRNMALRSIRRADRRGAEVHTVAEEKFCILFTSEFNVGGNELKYQVWTLSSPVIVTVHGNQECQATATYLWDNQFSELKRIPFQVPDTVPWPELAKMLSTKFEAMTGRGLNDSNLKYLANKLFGTSGQVDFSNHKVSWVQFNKENLQGRSFTFWEWFWAVGKLVKEHLKAPWMDGLIVGFMDRNESNGLLLGRPNGTFLLRFSDGTIGGVTIAWVADNGEMTGDRQVWNLAPFTIKDFQIRGLADRVKDLSSLVTLYPDIPKDQAFSRYYTMQVDPSQVVTASGYVKTTLMVIIDGQQPGPGATDFSNPQTPRAIANGDPASPLSMSNQSVAPSGDANGIDSIMDLSEIEGSGITLASPEYSNEDSEIQNINDWLSAQGNFLPETMT
ncbi:Signal transducer and activator of transcription 5B [Mactra antiquata]